MKPIWIIFSLIAMSLMTWSVHAQQSCDNPFAGSTIRFDPAYWTQTDFCQHVVPYEDILWGGVPPDGIPPIDSPRFESLESASTWLQPQSPVIALVIGETARAYPLAILTWHEIVNDVLADVPVAVTFCPLCNSAVVFDRRVGDETLTFGVSGNLRNSDLIMWDRQSQSWWQQLTGEGIVGFYAGTQLTLLPSLVTGFGAFSAAFPDGEVLSRETGIRREYGVNPYVNYDITTQPFLFDGVLDDRLPPTAHVLAALVSGEAVAYPFSLLADAGVINDTVGNIPVVAVWQGGAASALGARSIDDGRDIGWAALYRREVAGRVLTFDRDADALRDLETGTTWNAFGEATAGSLAGARLQLMISAPHFWFAWAAFMPQTRIYSQMPP